MAFKIKYTQEFYDGSGMASALHTEVLETEEEVLEWLAQTNADVRRPELERSEDYYTRKVYDIIEYKILRTDLLPYFKVDLGRVDNIISERQHEKDLKEASEEEEEAIKKKAADLKKLAELKKEYE